MAKKKKTILNGRKKKDGRVHVIHFTRGAHGSIRFNFLLYVWVKYLDNGKMYIVFTLSLGFFLKKK